jgi:hypothetical protein
MLALACLGLLALIPLRKHPRDPVIRRRGRTSLWRVAVAVLASVLIIGLAETYHGPLYGEHTSPRQNYADFGFASLTALWSLWALAVAVDLFTALGGRTRPNAAPPEPARRPPAPSRADHPRR